MKYIILLLLPFMATASTLRDPGNYELQSVALAVVAFLSDNPAGLCMTSSDLALAITTDRPDGPYLRLPKARVTPSGVIAESGGLYLVIASTSGVCVMVPDSSGNYNGKGARYYYCPLRISNAIRSNQ